MNKITIIVPIYNVEKYLKTCFDSLLKQNFKEFEVWAINDGSPDNSKIIMDEYAQNHPNIIKAIYKENGGYGSVLEYAINNIQTEYFLVCDPDDYLSDNTLSHLYSLATNNSSDITIGAKAFIYENSTDEDYDLAYNNEFVTLVNEQVYNKFDTNFKDLFFIDPSPHAKLYKTDIIKNVSFPHKVGYTDNLLFYISMLNAKKVIYTNKLCAYYLVDRAGNTMTDLNPKVISAHILVFKEILKIASKIKDVPSIFYYRIFESYKFIFRDLKRINATDEEINIKGLELYELLLALKPYKKAILDNYKVYSKSLRNEMIKDHLLFGCFSKTIYLHDLKKLIKTKGQ